MVAVSVMIITTVVLNITTFVVAVVLLLLVLFTATVGCVHHKYRAQQGSANSKAAFMHQFSLDSVLDMRYITMQPKFQPHTATRCNGKRVLRGCQ